ncbi:MAG: hypothetical protein LC732_07385, partial [Acidobacteria bacterium]|nr:hypothetical protein [Acidobacteriota bacterium]
DASSGGVPMAFGGAGIVDRVITPPRAEMGSQAKARFQFTNISDRDQYVKALRVTQSSAGTARLSIEPTGIGVDKTVEPGEDIEIDLQLTVYPTRSIAGQPDRGALRGTVRLDTLLVMRDGTVYRYPIEIPVEVGGF